MFAMAFKLHIAFQIMVTLSRAATVWECGIQNSSADNALVRRKQT